MEEDILILPIDICRICTNLHSNLDILTTKLEDEQVLLHEALEFVSCIRTDFDDGMSRTMCFTCSKMLSEAYKFKNQVLDSYRTFYNQTSDFNFKKEDSIHDDDSIISIVEMNSSMGCNEQEKPALVKERANELGIKLSTNAASFLLQHNNYKTKNKKEPLSKEDDQRAEHKTAAIEQIQTEPLLYRVDNIERPSIAYETFIIEAMEENELSRDDIQTEENCLTAMENHQVDNSVELTSKNNKFSCHICHKTLAKKSNLRDHLRLHANEKNFVCSFCQKSFVQIGNYQTHLRVHTKERPYRCHLCPKTYSQSGSLKTHIRLHTNERNYVCKVCYKAFTNSSDLDKHTRIHDLSRQFVCKTCGRLFPQKINLRVHERNVHFEKINK